MSLLSVAPKLVMIYFKKDESADVVSSVVLVNIKPVSMQ